MIDWQLVHVHKLRLHEVEELTIAEIALYMDKGEARPANGGMPMGLGEMSAYLAWWQQLTPRERLEQAKRP